MNDLYFSRNIIRVIKLSRRIREGHVAGMWGRRGAYWVLVGKRERKVPLGRPRLRWEDSIKMHLQEFREGDMDWIDLAQDKER